MSNDATCIATPDNPAELRRLRHRLERLIHAIDGATGERDLVMYRAVKHGASIEDVARWARAPGRGRTGGR